MSLCRFVWVRLLESEGGWALFWYWNRSQGRFGLYLWSSDTARSLALLDVKGRHTFKFMFTMKLRISSLESDCRWYSMLVN